MNPSFDDLLSAYVGEYPQTVRDVAETFCASTTRLGGHAAIPMQPPMAEIRRCALAKGIDADMLGAAVAAYARVESSAEAMQRAMAR